MVKRNKIMSAILAVSLFGVLLAGCSPNAGSSTQEGGNAASQAASNAEERTLKIMTGVIGGKTSEENTQFEQEIERLTGIKVTMNKPAADYDQKLLAAIASGEKFDLLQISKEKMSTFIDQGILTPLTDQVTGSKVLSDPNVIPAKEWEQVKTKDGEIYGIFTKYQGGTMPIVRKDWLNKLNLPEPETLEDYYNVLKAFTEQDPDGNGKKDTYGLSTAGMYELQGFFSAAGLKQRYVETAEGKLDVPYSTDAAIPVYEWLNKLFKEGILDPNFTTNDTGKMRDLFLTDRVGMITYWDAWVGMLNNTRHEQDPNTKFEAKGLPGAADANGNHMLRRGDPDVWVVPVNAEHPKTAFEFIEWWHSEEGITLGSLGIKDVDYTIDNSGKYVLTQTGKEHASDHGVPFWYNRNVEAPFGKLPGVQEAQELVDQYASLELTPPNWSNAEKIINEHSFKAIMGELPAADAVRKMREELKAGGYID
ncbi:extracellular solute-binding protein [Virgibacillus sp. LDC1]|uniref:extracellular solute-binding protein n=1 Tax=Paenibacillus TaxID=44249 RepID=UPI000C27CD36|nr:MULTISPECIES: extracellular solute-binding protein [Paenibacillus]MCV4231531.1 extracellular solute-binding protein [Virgibacillus sp. LDC1]MEC0256544.1 extracellular solute-binding protein [Paenibacillus lautus]PJN55433.1 Lipoprotein LipO precursor [Paenibacillus sp. GM2FR]